MTGVTTGTPAYMAPEQVMGHQVGPAADRYSLATIAYEMLAGAIPFDGEGLMEMLYAQVHREPSPPSVHVTSLGPEVDAVIMRGLAKDPAARWESCTAFADALGAALAAPVGAVTQARTVTLRPGAAVTRPSAPPRPSGKRAPATMVMPLPAAYNEQVVPAAANGTAAHVATRKSRRRPFMITGALALVLVLLLVLGVCAAVAAQGPRLSLAPSTVAAGGHVLVTADRVPANKTGEIQLLSQVSRFPFQASASGTVSREITVPVDITLGDHTVQICWDSACRAHQTLHVVAAGTVLQTPVANPTAGASPTPGQTPASTPPVGSTPGASPRPRVSPTAAPTSPPTNPPSPKPTPTSPPAATVNANPSSGIVADVTSIAVTGANFTASQAVTITVTQPGKSQTFSASTQSNGSFSTSIKLSTLKLWSIGTATLKACDSAGKCASTTISIV
jgi:hypothetical protein